MSTAQCALIMKGLKATFTTGLEGSELLFSFVTLSMETRLLITTFQLSPSLPV